VLELAFEQEEHASANELISAAETGEFQLRIPAFALVEPLFTILNRAVARSALIDRMEHELRDLRRSAHSRETADAVAQVPVLLSTLRDDQLDRLEAVQRRLSEAASIVIPVTSEVLLRARVLEPALALDPGDAVICASVEADAIGSRTDSILVARDKDLLTERVREHFAPHNCRVIGSFGDGLAAAQAG
jgi:predicted nucleic acid-binding protein